jgi:hypothetical protein
MPRRRPPFLIIVLAATAASPFVAACGSSSPTTTTTGSNSTRAQFVRSALPFTDCMRTHGVPDFPDPASGLFKVSLAPSTRHSPAFHSAYASCGHLLPNDGGDETHSPAQIAAYVAFASCIRSHGFPTFPDPTSTGQLTHAMVASAGIDLHQPGVLQAGDACVGVSHGLITRADVARFVAEG